MNSLVPTQAPLTTLEVLHLDDEMVAVVKPGGMTVHRHDRSPRGELHVLQTLSRQLDRYVYPVHRLDRATSGVLVMALNSVAARALHDHLTSDAALKTYITLVRGETPESFVSDRPLTVRRGGAGLPPGGNRKQPARTSFQRLAVFSRCSLLRATLHTGRHHQVRRHLAHLAHQVIGDTSYGKGRINAWFRENHGLPRMVLHAERLVIPHPRTGAPLDLRAPLSQDLRDFLLRLPGVDAALVGRLSSAA